MTKHPHGARPAGFLDHGNLHFDPLAGQPERPCYVCGEPLVCFAGDIVDLVVVGGNTLFVICGQCAGKLRAKEARKIEKSLAKSAKAETRFPLRSGEAN